MSWRLRLSLHYGIDWSWPTDTRKKRRKKLFPFMPDKSSQWSEVNSKRGVTKKIKGQKKRR